MTSQLRVGSSIVSVLLISATAGQAGTQENQAGHSLLGHRDVSETGKIGRVHDRIRRASVWEEVNRELSTFYGDYTGFKAKIKKETGLSWTATTSWLQQWGAPGGGASSGQLLSTPGVDWQLFDSDRFGTGSLQVSYTVVQYPWRQSAVDIGDNLGLITEINDFPGRGNSFPQLTYTHALPGNKLLLSVGQYPFYNFDGNQYLADQQQNFNSYVLAQNGTSTYPVAGLGSYAQINVTSTIQLAAGFQSAVDPSGNNLTSAGFGPDHFAWFGYGQWTPKFSGLGSAQYSFMYYDVPDVPLAPASKGWSFSAVQNLDETWAVFGRANGAWGETTQIRASYALGAAMNNPLGRSKTDQIGLALAYSDAANAPINPPGARSEKIIELYWNWTLFDVLLVTPDVQYIRDPSLAPDKDDAWALSLRATLLF